jgi:hypothetical protein
MKKLSVLSVTLLVAGALSACSSSTSTKCTTSSQCTAGNVCQTEKCVERPCNGTADCNTPDICVDGAALGMDAAKRFCTALQCGEGLPCPNGQDCLGGICIPGTTDVIETDTVGDTPDRDVPGEDTATDPGTDVPVVIGVDCKACSSDADCGGTAKCLPVGATKHCLSACTDDGDCPRSFICYAASTASKSCLPVSYNCVACAVETPCEANKVCDFVSATCKEGNPVCGKCTYDFDCAAGLRCYKTTGSATGACVAECTDSCTDSDFTCGTTEKGVQLCQPKDPTKCGGCEAPTPFPSPDGLSCFGCLNNSHCTVQGETCNMNTHACTPDNVCPGQRQCPADSGNCQDCCEDADCPDVDGVATGPCTANKCVNQIDPCNGQCSGTQFPVCKTINGIPQCVQCEATSDCASLGDASCTCSGDPTYTCLTPDGNVCQPPTCGAICSTDADCPPDANGGSLLCSGAVNGFCYNPTGACDGSTSCCGAGQSCFDIISSLFGGMGMPGGGAMPGMGGYCTCDDSHACMGGKPCTSTDGLCSIPILSDMLCPGGVKPSTMPDKVCVDIMELLSGLLGGI